MLRGAPLRVTPQKRPVARAVIGFVEAVECRPADAEQGRLPVRGLKPVEIDPAKGKQVAVKLVDNAGGPPPGAGALFGLIAVAEGVYFVDDASNTFNLLH